MKKIIHLALIGAVFAPVLAYAGSLQLLPADTGDLVATQLTLAKAAPPASVERAPVDFAWALDPQEPLSRQAPFVAESREFWTDLDADQLQKGYRFQTTAPGALVRLSPKGQSKSRGLQLSDLGLRLDGKALDLTSAVVASADATQMKAAGVDFNEGTVVFQLAPNLAPGSVELSAKRAKGEYLLQVYEPDSPIVLSLTTGQDRLLAGGSLTLTAKWQATQDMRQPRSIGALVSSPDGYSKPLKFVRTKNGDYQATMTLPADAGSGLQLWEVHSFGVLQSKTGTIARDAKTSFSVSRPTARLSGEAHTSQAKSKGLSVGLSVEVASPGRYELRGVLYGTDAMGALKPFAIAHAARWMEPGVGNIDLAFGDLAAKSGMTAPFELRDLQLNDQARLGLLETRARAVRFELD